MPRALPTALAFALGFILGTYGVVAASAQSLPGDQLYSIKRAAESAQMLLAPTQTRPQLEEHFAEERVQEVQQLTAQGRTAEVEFGGALESISGEQWLVAGVAVKVPPGTPLIGVPFPGLFVKVHGASQPDGTVLATSVEVEGSAFVGVLTSMSEGVWQVGTVTVIVDQQTAIIGQPQVGDEVEVRTRILPDGLLLALEIKVTAAGPQATLVPPTRMPSPAPLVTVAPLPTATPSPTSTAGEKNEEVEFTGVVEAIGVNAWQIGGQTVVITPATEIRGLPQIGQRVEVKAVRDAQGTLIARRIEPKEDSGEAGATETPPALRTLLPGGAGTAVASPTPKPEESSTPETTDDHEGEGDGPSPSNTPEP